MRMRAVWEFPGDICLKAAPGPLPRVPAGKWPWACAMMAYSLYERRPGLDSRPSPPCGVIWTATGAGPHRGRRPHRRRVGAEDRRVPPLVRRSRRPRPDGGCNPPTIARPKDELRQLLGIITDTVEALAAWRLAHPSGGAFRPPACRNRQRAQKADAATRDIDGMTVNASPWDTAGGVGGGRCALPSPTC